MAHSGPRLANDVTWAEGLFIKAGSIWRLTHCATPVLLLRAEGPEGQRASVHDAKKKNPTTQFSSLRRTLRPSQVWGFKHTQRDE